MSKAILPSIVAVLSLSLATTAMATNPQGKSGTGTPDQDRVVQAQPNDSEFQTRDDPGSTVSEAQVRATLQARGYTRIAGPELRGENFEVKAMKEGQRFTVVVDAETGQVKAETVG